jgi:hypothetical protein
VPPVWCVIRDVTDGLWASRMGSQRMGCIRDSEREPRGGVRWQLASHRRHRRPSASLRAQSVQIGRPRASWTVLPTMTASARPHAEQVSQLRGSDGDAPADGVIRDGRLGSRAWRAPATEGTD